jgi:small subunit ribosomal protein S6
MRPYEIMVILDPTLDERTVAPSLETFLNVVRKDGGSVDKVDIWGKRRLAYEIAKQRVRAADQGPADRQALVP